MHHQTEDVDTQYAYTQEVEASYHLLTLRSHRTTPPLQPSMHFPLLRITESLSLHRMVPISLLPLPSIRRQVLLNTIIIPMKEPQHRLSHQQPIMHPIRPFRGLIRILLLHTATLNPHLQLSLNQSLIKLHMPLCRKKPFVDIHALDARVFARAPDMYFCPAL
jgi:hypothetical protein